MSVDPLDPLEALECDITIAIETGLSSELITVLKNAKDLKHFIDTRGNYVLHTAIYHKNFSLVKILLDYGFDINGFDLINRTPIMCSMYFQDCFVVDYLVSRGAKLHVSGMSMSVLSLGFHYGHFDAIKSLFDQFFLVDIETKYYSHPTGKVIKINQSAVTEQFKDTLKTNARLFLTHCRLSLVCKACITQKLFPL